MATATLGDTPATEVPIETFATCWLAAWQALGGVIAQNRAGQNLLWYPINDQAGHRQARRTLLAELDGLGVATRDAVFAAALAGRAA